MGVQHTFGGRAHQLVFTRGHELGTHHVADERLLEVVRLAIAGDGARVHAGDGRPQQVPVTQHAHQLGTIHDWQMVKAEAVQTRSQLAQVVLLCDHDHVASHDVVDARLVVHDQTSVQQV